VRREPLALLLRERLDGNCHSLYGGQRTANCKPGLGRRRARRDERLVVSHVAAGLLPGRARPRRVPGLLREPVPDGRAQHDRLPDPRGGAVRALGRPGPRRLRVRAEAAWQPGCARWTSSSHACERSANGFGPIRVQVPSARDDGMLELLLARSIHRSASPSTSSIRSWDGVEERLTAAGAVRVNDLETPATVPLCPATRAAV